MSLFETVRTQLGGLLAGASADGEGQAPGVEPLGGALLDMIRSRGLGSFLNELSSKGLGTAVASWVGLGPNHPISAEQIEQILGSDQAAQLAERFGLPAEQVRSTLAQLLPHVVDQLTPEGRVEEPVADEGT